MKKLREVFLLILIAISVIGCSDTSVNKKTMTIAHRGADDRAPEETMPAFKLAFKEKVNYLEMDLRETKDNKLVLMHDPILNRTTNGKGEVNHYSLKQLKKLDAGSWFNKKYKGERIITLDELINQMGSKTKYFIETRLVDNKLKMEIPLIDLMNKRGLVKKNKVVIESFSARSLKKIHRLNKNVPLVQLTLFDNKKAFTSKNMNEWKKYAMGIGLNSDLVDKKLVCKLHQNHLKIYVFFFDAKKEKAEQKRVIQDGADGVFTNHISYSKSLLKLSKK